MDFHTNTARVRPVLDRTRDHRPGSEARVAYRPFDADRQNLGVGSDRLQFSVQNVSSRTRSTVQ
jgi:hypothetical protein